MTEAIATLSLDLDDLWCYQRSFGLDSWQSYPSFLPQILPRVLDFLEDNDVRASIFVVGRDAAKPELQSLLAEITARGHEVGNHSLDHHLELPAWPAEKVATDLQTAHDAILHATGVAPVGFRSPAFGLSSAVLKTLIKLDYQYDASSFSNSLNGLARYYHNRRSGHADATDTGQNFGSRGRRTQRPFCWRSSAGTLLELPVTSLPLLRLPMHGTYLHHLADQSHWLAKRYWRLAMAMCRWGGVPPSFLLHVTDFIGCDDSLPVNYLPGMRATATEKMQRLQFVLSSLQHHHRLMSLGAYADLLQQDDSIKSVSLVND